MFASIRSTRGLATATLAAFSLAALACSDSAGPDDDHADDVAAIRLTIGAAQTVTVSGAGATMTLPANVATTVTAVFLDDHGDVVDVHDDEFELLVTPAAGITFTRTGAFRGTMLGTAAGTVNVQFGLFHLMERHTDFGPFTVAATVTP